MTLFPPLPDDTKAALDKTFALIEKTFPVPARFRAQLPKDAAALSRLLTSARGERGLSYLGRPGTLSAYLRYFLPWNLYRLCRLFSSEELCAPAFGLQSGDAVTDLGSGPLTFTIALWLARPELRNVPLEFRCVDQTPSVLKAGAALFAALAPASPWKIKTIHGKIGAAVYGKKAALVTAVNLFNELYQDMPHSAALAPLAQKYARMLAALACDTHGNIFVAEPGMPRSGRFIAALRAALPETGHLPVSPCAHKAACPLCDTEKWCHFAFGTEDAPAALRKFSASAGLPKDRAVISFLYAATAAADAAAAADATASTAARVISDAFPLNAAGPEKWGRYGCSAAGLVLLCGEKETLDVLPSGSLAECRADNPDERDPKSGALIRQPSAQCHAFFSTKISAR